MNKFWFGVLPIFWFLCVASSAEMRDREREPERIPIGEGKHGRLDGDRIRTLYDKEKNVIVYKYSRAGTCLMETITGLDKSIGKFEKTSIRTVQKISRAQILLDEKQVKSLGGKRIWKFCKGFKTSLLKETLFKLSDGNPKKTEYKREKRQIRPRFRGQTQSQFMGFGDGKGSAEAVSQPDVSKTLVSGVNGIGQAQSQSGGRDCDGCYPESGGSSGRRFDAGRETGRPEGETVAAGRDGARIPDGSRGTSRPTGFPDQQEGRQGGKDGSTDHVGSATPGGKDFSSSTGTSGRNGAPGPGFSAGPSQGGRAGTGDSVGPGGLSRSNGGTRFSPSSQGSDFSRTNGHEAGTGTRHPPSAFGRPYSSRPGETNGRYPPSSSSKPYRPSSEDRRFGNGNVPPSSSDPSYTRDTGGRFPHETGGHIPRGPPRPAGNDPSYRYPPSSYGKPTRPAPDRQGSDRTRPLVPSSETGPSPPVRYPPSSSSKPYYPTSGGSSSEPGRDGRGSTSGSVPSADRRVPQNGFRPERYPPSAFSKSTPPHYYPPSSGSRVRPHETGERYYPDGGKRPHYDADGAGPSRTDGYGETQPPCETESTDGAGPEEFPTIGRGREGEGYDDGRHTGRPARPSPSGGGGRTDFRPETGYPSGSGTPESRPDPYGHDYPEVRSSRPSGGGYDDADRPGIHGDPSRGGYDVPKRPDGKDEHFPGAHRVPSGGGYDRAGLPGTHGGIDGTSRPHDGGRPYDRAGPSGSGNSGRGRPGGYQGPSGGSYDGPGGNGRSHVPEGRLETDRPSSGGGSRHGDGRPGTRPRQNGEGYDGDRGHGETGRTGPSGGSRHGTVNQGTYRGSSGRGYDGADGHEGGGRDDLEGKSRPEERGRPGEAGRSDVRGVGYDISGIPGSRGSDRSDTRPGSDGEGPGRPGVRGGGTDGSLTPDDGSRKPEASGRPEGGGGRSTAGGLPGGTTNLEGEDGTGRVGTAEIPGGERTGGADAGEGDACSRGENCKGVEESQVQTSVTQDGNATRALSSAQGRFGAGVAQAQVSGIYTGSGSFSAQAQTSDDDKGAQVQVIGGSRGASSSAQGMGGRGQTQAQVQLGSKNGATSAEAQSGGIDFVTGTQVQAGAGGGSSEAQADGPGRTSTQAQIGFTPYGNKTDKEREQKVPFQGGVSASAQSGANVGQSQTELFGSFYDGISYTGSAQAGSGKSFGKIKQNNSTFAEGTENDKQSMTQIGFLNKHGLRPLPKFGQGILKGFKVYDLPGENPHSKKSNDSGEVADLVKENERASTTTIRNPKTGGNYSKEKSKPEIDKDAEILEAKNKEKNAEEDEENEDEYDEEEEDYEETADLKAKPVKYVAGEGIETRYGSVVEKDETITVKQKSPTQTQTVFIGGLDKKHDVHIEQDADENVKEGDVLQPGDRILGSDGFTVPQGYRGKVTSVAGQIGKTRASAPDGGRAQSQTVLVKPGTGKVHYTNPKPHLPSDYSGFTPYGNQPGPLSRLQNDKLHHTPYASSSIVNNGQKRSSQTYYTKSSGCGYYTFSCDVVFGSNGRAKICKPNPPTNPDGTPCVI